MNNFLADSGLQNNKPVKSSCVINYQLNHYPLL